MSSETAPIEPELSQNPRRLWRSPFNSWRYAIVFLFLISPLILRAWFLSKVPYIDVPFDVEEFCRVEIAPGQNSFDHYREAHRLWEAVGLADRANKIERPVADLEAVIARGWSAATDSLKSWLADRDAALAEWRRGTECEDALYLPIGEGDYSTFLPVTQTLSLIATCVQCEAARLESEGDFAGAAKVYIAILRSGRHSGRHSGVVERRVGLYLHKRSTEELIRWSEHSEITADQLRTTLYEVQSADRMTQPLSATLKDEYLAATNTFKRPDWLQTLNVVTGRAAAEPVATVYRAMQWLVGEPQCTERLLRHTLANQLREIDKPIPERQPFAETKHVMLFPPDPRVSLHKAELDPARIERAIQRSPVAGHCMPLHIKEFENEIPHERIRQVTLEVALAAQAYQRDHGAFPEDLNVLVPSYLIVVPLDPADTAGQPIRYQRDDPASAFVWSVGPGGKDGDVRGSAATDLDWGIHLKTR